MFMMHSITMGDDLAVMGDNVVLFYGRNKKPILDGLNINIPNGGMYGLLGASGCGKTTLLKCITGQLYPKSGDIRLYGQKLNTAGFCIPGKGVGYMPQDTALSTGITIEESFYYFGKLYYMSDVQIKNSIKFLTDLLKIPEKSSLISTLSGGQKRRVSFAIALIHNPPLLILDEPTVGVDPVLREKIWNHLESTVKKDGTTIIITTHYVEEARHCNVVGMMRKGRILVEANPDDLMKSYKAETLEEVFLNVCKVDFRLNNQSSSFHPELLNTDVSKKHVSKNCLIVSVDTEAVLDSGESDVCFDENEYAKLLNGKNESNNAKLSNGKNESNNAKLSNGKNESISEMMRYRVYKKLIYADTSLTKFKKTTTQTRAVMIKNFIQLRRNYLFALFMLLSPVVQVWMFSSVIGRKLVNIPMAITNLDSGSFGQKFLDSMDKDVIDMVHFSNMSSALESVRNGETWGALKIGPHFTSATIKRYMNRWKVKNVTVADSTLGLYLDVTNQQITYTILYTMELAFTEFGVHLLKAANMSTASQQLPIVIKERIYGSKDSTFSDYVIPNIAIGLSCCLSVILTAVTIIAEKKEGTIDRSLVAGTSFTEILLGILFSMFIVVIFQNILEIVSLLWILRFDIQGSLMWVFICLMFSSLNGMTLGLFISSICDSEFMAAVISISLYTPIFSYSGIIWPIESMPDVFRHLFNSLPLTALAEAMRSVCTRGWSMIDHNLWISLIIETIWILLLFVLSVLLLKQRRSMA